MAVRNSISALLTLLLLAGCAKTSGDYFFVSTETARTQGGCYDFLIGLDDSTATYAVRIAARLVGSRIPERQIAFDIRITSPVGETAIERRTFPIGGNSGFRLVKGSGSVIDCEWLLQEGLRISGTEAGPWQISVSPTDPVLLEALYGVGLSCEANYGKR